MVITALDVTAANVYKAISGYPFYSRAQKEAERMEKEAERIRGDVHWNEAGHKLIAENFLSFYRNNSKGNIEICVRDKYSAGHE